MASLSIARRRQAWLAGVVCGATGQGVCLLKVPKLKEIYTKGVAFGRLNAETPGVKAIVAARRRPVAKKPIARPADRYRTRARGSVPTRFDRPSNGPRRSF